MYLSLIPYFLDYKTHFPLPPKIWEENRSVSYSLNVAYLGPGFSLFSSSKT